MSLVKSLPQIIPRQSERVAGRGEGGPRQTVFPSDAIQVSPQPKKAKSAVSESSVPEYCQAASILFMSVTFNMLYLKTKTFANLKNSISKGFYVGRVRYLKSV